MLHISNLKVNIETADGTLRAVDDVSLTVKKGETIGIVGESGSGKSILAQSILRLNAEPLVSYPEGEIVFEKRHVLNMTEKEIQTLRAEDISIVFQDPMSSLNPVFTIGYQLIEAIRVREKMSRKKARSEAIELLEDVGISDAKRRMKEYPHQFSGGMRQRVLIAIALASKPKVLIADEPTTALDVTIQAQILNVFKHVQEKYGMAIIMITHDLGVVANLADRVYVMYAGRILEEGTVDDIFYRTANPYTLSLLRSQPSLVEASLDRLYSIPGHPPQLINPPTGCHFAARCPLATEDCLAVRPSLSQRGMTHRTACHLSAEHVRKQIGTSDTRKVSVQKGVAL